MEYCRHEGCAIRRLPFGAGQRFARENAPDARSADGARRRQHCIVNYTVIDVKVASMMRVDLRGLHLCKEQFDLLDYVQQR